MNTNEPPKKEEYVFARKKKDRLALKRLIEKYPVSIESDPNSATYKAIELFRNNFPVPPTLIEESRKEQENDRQKRQEDPEYYKRIYRKNIESLLLDSDHSKLNFGGVIKKPSKDEKRIYAALGIETKKVPLRKCQWCDKFYYAKKIGQIDLYDPDIKYGEEPFSPRRYCSDDCKRKSNNLQRNQKKNVEIFDVCICGKSLEGKRAGTRTCSPACRQKLWKKNHPEK